MELKSNKDCRLLFLVTEDWYFVSHRIGLAIAAVRFGCEVHVVCRTSGYEQEIKRQGILLHAIKWVRGKVSIRDVFVIRKLYRAITPTIAHHVALKPVVFGTLAAYLVPGVKVVNAINGFGYVYSSNSIKARLLRPLLRYALKLVLHRSDAVIVQNRDDEAHLRDKFRLPHGKLHLVRGSGVDTTRFSPAPEPEGKVVFVLVARMLWDKGIGEFVDACRQLKNMDLEFRGLLVGPVDTENPAAIPLQTLHDWQVEGVIEYLGPLKEIDEIWRNSHVAVLPSYREGLPKALLEAGASGRPMISCDVPGCREVVIHGDTGLLVPPRDSRALAMAMKNMVKEPGRRMAMGSAARDLVCREFSEEKVVHETLSIYQNLISR